MKSATALKRIIRAIKIVRESASWNDYFTTLATQAAGSGAPDIIQMYPQYVKVFSANGVLLDLNDPVPKGIIDPSHFSPSAIRTGLIDGRNMMISIGLSTNGFIVNTAILKELAIPLSQFENLSWDSFAALCNEITWKSNGTGGPMGSTIFYSLYRTSATSVYYEN